jgi:hypothetical protein
MRGPSPPAQALRSTARSLDGEHGYSAVAVWSVRIVDSTGTLSNLEPKFSIGPPGAVDTLRTHAATGQAVPMSPGTYLSSYATVEPAQGSWAARDTGVVYDGVFVVELRPGSHAFFHLRLESETQSGGWKRSSWLSVPLDAVCAVEAARVYDLGILEVAVTARSAGGANESYECQVVASTVDPRNDKKLRRLCPSLALPGAAMVRVTDGGGFTWRH